MPYLSDRGVAERSQDLHGQDPSAEEIPAMRQVAKSSFLRFFNYFGLAAVATWLFVAVPPAMARPTGAAAALAELPIRFEANRGQAPPSIRYLSRGPTHTLALERIRAELVVHRLDPATPDARGGEERVRIRLLDARPEGTAEGETPLPGRFHFFAGDGKGDARHVSNVPTYERVRMPDVYPGIDWVFHGSLGELEFDFEVQPEAHPEAIAFTVDGARRLEVDPKGRLIAHLASETIHLEAPVLYQLDEDARRVAVEGRFRLEEDSGRIGFEVGAYDESRLLVIDPVIQASTMLSASAIGFPVAMKLDGTEALVIAGDTTSHTFPSTPGALQEECGGAEYSVPLCDTPFFPVSDYPTDYTGSSYTEYDAFVAKVRLGTGGGPSTLVWATFLGGLEEERLRDLEVDANGRVHIVGSTRSREFPTTDDAVDRNLSGFNELPGIFKFYRSDGFYTVLSPDGAAIEYSTLLGQSGDEAVTAFALDAAGHAILAGTGSFILDGALTESAFVTKLDQDATPEWTWHDFHSGACGVGTIVPTGVASDDENGFVHIAGETTCAAFTVTPSARQPTCASCGVLEPDGFVMALEADGSTRRQASFLGGSEADGATDLTLTPEQNPVVVGYTRSADFPTLEALSGFGGGNCSISIEPCADGFVSVFLGLHRPELLYSDFVGGSDDDFIDAVHVRGGTGSTSGWPHEIYLTGSTFSTDFPTLNPVQANCALAFGSLCDENAFVTVLERDRIVTCCRNGLEIDFVESMLFSTYLGAATLPGGDGDNYATGIDVSEFGWIHVAGSSGAEAFPAVLPIPGSAPASDGGVFGLRLTPLPEPGLGFALPAAVALLAGLVKDHRRRQPAERRIRQARPVARG